MTDILTPKLKAYWCEPKDGFVKSADLVFAESRSQAKSIALARQESYAECEYTEIRATRNPLADKYADSPEHRNLIERGDSRMWREVGGCGDIQEPRCVDCGKAVMGGEFPLCEDCYCCAECTGPLTSDGEYWTCGCTRLPFNG